MAEHAIIRDVEHGSGSADRKRALAEEAELIQRCIDGERAAQESFYRRYRQNVAANLYRVLNDPNELDDLVQEVFVIAFRGLPKFRGDARLSTWLYRICVNVALGRIRSRTRRPPPVLVPDPEPARDPATATQETPERALQREQARRRVWAVLDAMPAKKREVLFLHEICGLELKEIARHVNANPVTVRTRLFYARKEFYKRVAEGDES